MRKWIAILAGVVVLLAVNVSIFQREKLLTDGRTVLLELAPVDPRSLMQGDYMALNFAIANQAFRGNESQRKQDGHIVAALNEEGVAQFVRFADGKPLAANEVLLRYRVRDERFKFATNAFFFEEGQATVFEAAKYGEFKVAENGDMILTAMRDAGRKKLGG